MDSQRHLIDDHDACVHAARSALGDARFKTAVDHGRHLPADVGIAYALNEPTVRRRGVKATDPPVLTGRQMEVAELIARGLTNREIARKLGISTRTAESHVGTILTKLGLTSRAQVAPWTSATEPTPPTGPA
jgi:non-specific serine/threonine protein kinase